MILQALERPEPTLHFAQQGKELVVARVPGDRGRNGAQQLNVLAIRQPLLHSHQDVFAQVVVANDASPADLAAPGLELRLNEGDGGAAGSQVGQRLGQGQRQRDERYVDDQQVNRLGQLEGRRAFTFS